MGSSHSPPGTIEEFLYVHVLSTLTASILHFHSSLLPPASGGLLPVRWLVLLAKQRRRYIAVAAVSRAAIFWARVRPP